MAASVFPAPVETASIRRGGTFWSTMGLPNMSSFSGAEAASATAAQYPAVSCRMKSSTAETHLALISAMETTLIEWPWGLAALGMRRTVFRLPPPSPPRVEGPLSISH